VEIWHFKLINGTIRAILLISGIKKYFLINSQEFNMILWASNQIVGDLEFKEALSIAFDQF
jgi:hypothetical protein